MICRFCVPYRQIEAKVSLNYLKKKVLTVLRNDIYIMKFIQKLTILREIDIRQPTMNFSHGNTRILIIYFKKQLSLRSTL